MKYALMIGLLVFVHDNYPSYCCNGDGVHGDCKPVDCDAIAETKTGVDYDGLHWDSDQIYPSFDTRCHACIRPGVPQGASRAPICIFVQPSS